jgi:hypothetical protein
MMNSTRRIVFLIALVGFAAFAFSTQACEFCNGEREKPLIAQFEDAEFVLIGHFENAKAGGNGEGSTDFVIERVYKEHAKIKGEAKITLPRFVPNSKIKYIVFGDIYQGKINAYKGAPIVNDSEMLRYIDGLVKVKAKTPGERLRYAFDFLNSPESDVSMDAYREFGRSDYADYKEMAKTLPPDKIAGWLKDPKTPAYRYSLYASLLGHCGKAEHGQQLRKMMDDIFADKHKGAGMHGLLVGYLMIEPEKGWTYVKDLVKDPGKNWLARFTGLQAMRFLYESRPDLRNKDADQARKEIVQGELGAMARNDLADFVIEDMRKWKRWECSGQVLGMFGKKDFNLTTHRRAILRYALQCPNDACKKFVSDQRALNKDWVDDTKEILELESR